MKNVNIFVRTYLLIAGIVLISTGAQAQLSGTYTIGGTNPDYSTLSAAISDLNSQGVNGPVVFNIRDGNYSGSSWRGSVGNVSGASATNTITFKSQSDDATKVTLSPSGSSSANYVFQLNEAKYIIIKDITLNNTGSSYGCDVRLIGSASYNTVENCILTGHTGNTTSTNKSRVYGTSLSGSNNSFRGNEIVRGSYGIYLRGSNSSSVSYNNELIDNTFTQNYYYAYYMYYHGNLTVTGNKVSRTGSGTYYGGMIYATRDMLTFSNNEFNTSTSSTTYASRVYYTNYYSNNKNVQPLITNNTYNVHATSSNSVYGTYEAYGRYVLSTNNTVNMSGTSSSGYMYVYPMYYGYDCRTENNTYNFSRTSGGYIRPYCIYRGTNDTFANNTINVSGNGYLQGYTQYYGTGAAFLNNEIKASSNTRYMYMYSYRGYSGIVANNKFDYESNSGYVYGIYSYYDNADIHIYNNVITAATSNTIYLLYCYRPYGAKYSFNTCHSYGTNSSSNYGCYVYNSSSSYYARVYNNIFSSDHSSAYAYYIYSEAKMESDYNLFYTTGSRLLRRVSSSLSTASLDNWREKTGLDMNSLNYDPGYVDAANKDLRPDATKADVWAVNGRAVHDTVVSVDIAGNPRPTVVTAGVPDVGAYEVIPASTPPNATATPANPVANSTQVFTFGQDTVMTIDWGATVPSNYTVRQYTGLQAAPMPAGVGRMFFYVAGTPSTWTHDYKPHVYYKEPWLGDVSSEQNAVIARSSNSGAWEGYNYTNAATDINRNILSPTNQLDSVGSYTGVENGRIGIRCVENPKGIAISNITAFAADLDWDAVFNPVGYQVIVKKTPEMPTTADWASSSAFPTTNSHAAIGLSEDTKYYVFIRTVCGPKDTSGVSIDSFITLITCHEPDVKISNLTTSRAVVSWDTIKTAVKYEFVVNEDANPPVFGTDLYKTSTLVPFLDENKQYYAHVRTHCSSIYSNSNWKTVPFTTKGTSVNDISNAERMMSIYPNPVADELHISFSDKRKGEGTVSVTDITGKTIRQYKVNAEKFSINVSTLPAGTYLLQYHDTYTNETSMFNKK